MADEPNDLPPGSKGEPTGGPPPGPFGSEELLRRDAELAAAMQAKLDEACRPALPIAPGSNKLGARKDAKFKAICTAPSINWTPAGSGQVPVPYQTVQDLSNSMSTARTVKFNGSPAYLLDQTTQPKGTGDERGTGKGIRSGTVTGEVKPVSGCKTVRIEGKQVVREGDKCTMNGGNNPGAYAAKAQALPAPNATGTMMKQLKAAVDAPASAIAGVVKSFLNTVPDLLEAGLHGSAIQQVTELQERQHLLYIFGHSHEANKLRQSAEASRKAIESIAVPKLPYFNDAERAGATVALAIEVLTTGAGFLKVGRFFVKKIEKAPEVVKPLQSANMGGGVKIATIPPKRKTAAERSSAFQGQEPYPGKDALKNIELKSGKRVVQITFSKDGRPISEYFTTESAVRRSTLPDGNVDANKLNQGLQIYASIDPQTGLQRGDFKRYIQLYELTDDIPRGEVAFGRTKANPRYNPDENRTLPQVFINSEQHSKLRALDVKEMINTKTPIYKKP